VGGIFGILYYKGNIMEGKFENEDKVALFIYDPERDPELEDLVIMMLYFEKHEKYERCAILKEMALELQKKE
jgi:hypothetical protein